MLSVDVCKEFLKGCPEEEVIEIRKNLYQLAEILVDEHHKRIKMESKNKEFNSIDKSEENK